MSKTVRVKLSTLNRVDRLKRGNETVADFFERIVPATTPELDEARRGLDEARERLEKFYERVRAEDAEAMQKRLKEINESNSENRKKLDTLFKDCQMEH